jgi:hypothetical protein
MQRNVLNRDFVGQQVLEALSGKIYSIQRISKDSRNTPQKKYDFENKGILESFVSFYKRTYSRNINVDQPLIQGSLSDPVNHESGNGRKLEFILPQFCYPMGMGATIGNRNIEGMVEVIKEQCVQRADGILGNFMKRFSDDLEVR